MSPILHEYCWTHFFVSVMTIDTHTVVYVCIGIGSNLSLSLQTEGCHQGCSGLESPPNLTPATFLSVHHFSVSADCIDIRVFYSCCTQGSTSAGPLLTHIITMGGNTQGLSRYACYSQCLGILWKWCWGWDCDLETSPQERKWQPGHGSYQTKLS